MINHKSLVFLILALVSVFSGCDSGVQSTQVQDIVELQWKSDGSTIYGFFQGFTSTSTTTDPAVGYSVVRFNSDGSSEKTFDISPKSRPAYSYTPSIFLSHDGSSLLTQLENDLFRFNTVNGSLEKLTTLFHLLVASPDLHYVVGTPSPDNQPIKSIALYDVSILPIRLVKLFDVLQPAFSSGAWLSNGLFAITLIDSVGRHVAIYDSTGTLKYTIGGAEIGFHNFVYSAATNELFVKNYAGKTNDHTVDKVNLANMTRVSVLEKQAENFDVTTDGSTIVYSSYDSTNTITFRSRNIASKNEITLPTDILRIISLAPNNTKLAYVRKRDIYYNEVKVIPFTKP